MIKEYIVLFLGGVSLIGSIEISLYGINYYFSIPLLIIGMLFLIYGYAVRQKRQDEQLLIKNELKKLNQEVLTIKTIIDDKFQKNDLNIIIKQLSVLMNFPDIFNNYIVKVLKVYKTLNEKSQNEQNQFFSAMSKNYEELFEHILNNQKEYFNENNQFFRQQIEDIVSICKNLYDELKDVREKLNTFNDQVQDLYELDEKIFNVINDDIESHCNSISAGIDDLNQKIGKLKLDKNLDTMLEAINIMEDSNKDLINKITQMSKEDSEIIKDILNKL